MQDWRFLRLAACSSRHSIGNGPGGAACSSLAASSVEVEIKYSASANVCIYYTRMDACMHDA